MPLGQFGQLYAWMIEAFWLIYLLTSLVGSGICYTYRRLSNGVIIMLVSFLGEILLWGLWRLPGWGGWPPTEEYYVLVYFVGSLTSTGLITGLWITFAQLRRRLQIDASRTELPGEDVLAPWQPKPGGTDIHKG